VAAIAHQYEQAWELGRLSSREGPDHDAARLASRSLRRWGDAVFALQPRLAEALYARGLAIATIDPLAANGDELAWLLIGRAEGLGELGRHREAIEAADRGLDLVSTTEQTDTLGFALLALGRARSNVGAVDVARTLIERALVVFEASGSRVGAARAHHRLAEAQRFDDFAGELLSYRRAFALYGGIGRNASWSRRRPNC
jgi:tetratricopeptide (TPR) repeat protein